jgi:hypothetical protein
MGLLSLEVVATIFSLHHHFIGIFAEKAAAEGAFPAWISSMAAEAYL